MYKMINPIANLSEYGSISTANANFKFLMPGDFFAPVTKEEKDAVDPENPTLFDPASLKVAQGILWFSELLFGPKRISFVYDFLMGVSFLYLGYGYLSSFFFTCNFIAIPIEFLVLPLLPELDMPFFDWAA